MRVGEAWTHVELEAADGESLAGVGDAAGPFGQQAGHRGGAAVGQRDAEPLLDGLGRDVAVGLEQRRAGARVAAGPRRRARRRSRRPAPRADPRAWRCPGCRRTRRAPRPGGAARAACRAAGRRSSGWPGVTATGRTGSGSPGLEPEQVERVQHADDVVQGARGTPECGCSRSGRRPAGCPPARRSRRSPRCRCAASSPRAPAGR